ncbi:MAG TPA: ribosome-associated translation inhibitor RaiA [Thermomicrobiales bacterium]|nr:ribosome-associated translation inhibitor RaiA [Thermomicrobiales bacterium]
MDLQIKAHNIRLSDDLREYIEKRVTKLDRVNERIIEAKFELRQEKTHNPTQRFIAQFTIATPRAILRAEEKNTDPNAAIDIVTDKMSRQIKRFHERKIHRSKRSAVNLGQLAADQSPELLPASFEDQDEAADGVVVRTKRFPVLPMDTAEAIEQIELLGHDFFVFHNHETNQINVLYRRQDGQYGVLEPELA